MLRSNTVQGLKADQRAACREDHANHERGQRLKTPVSVGVIPIGRARGDAHPDQDDARRKHVAGELEPRRDDRGRVGEQSDDDVAAREQSADSDARQGDTASGSVRFVEDGHYGIVAGSERARDCRGSKSRRIADDSVRLTDERKAGPEDRMFRQCHEARCCLDLNLARTEIAQQL
jgi:hypothetical protein